MQSSEVESSRTHFEVLGLGLETSSPRKLACPRLEDSTIFLIVKILWSTWKIFWKTSFCEDRLKNFCEDLFFFFFWRLPEIFLWRSFFLESTCACVLGPWSWPRAFLSLASRVSVLGKAVLGLGLGFFLRPWPWPRALFPRLHLWQSLNEIKSISQPILMSTSASKAQDVNEWVFFFFGTAPQNKHWHYKMSFKKLKLNQNTQQTVGLHTMLVTYRRTMQIIFKRIITGINVVSGKTTKGTSEFYGQKVIQLSFEKR